MAGYRSAFSGLFILCAASSAALAQANKAPAPAAGGKVFAAFFDASSVVGTPTPLSLVLRETRQGAAVKQTEIEGCFAFSHASHKLDLVKGVMTVNGPALRFTGSTMVNKAPVDIVIQRAGKPDAVSFTGELNSQGKVVKFALPAGPLGEDTGPEAADAPPVSATPNADISVNTVSIALKPSAIAGIVPVLRKHKASVQETAFFADCDSLRANERKIVATVDPERATAFVQDAKAVAGVTNAGWMRGSFGVFDAVRLDAQAFTTNGQINRDKIVAAIEPAIAQVLGETATKNSPPSAVGVTTLSFGGPSQALPGVGLNETTDVNVFMSRENLQPNGPVLVYLGEIDADVVDTQGGIAVKEATDAESAPEDFGIVRVLILNAMAKALGGEVWNPEKQAWVKL